MSSKADYRNFFLYASATSSLTISSISRSESGFLSFPAAPASEARVGYFGVFTSTVPCGWMTKAILSLAVIPKCFRTATGIVTCPILVTVE